MDTNDIKALIEAYYEGNTSTEEENILFTYFSGDDIAEELQAEKEYFLQTSKLERADMPSGFPSRIDALFEDIERNETKSIRWKYTLVWASSIAAAVAIIFIVANTRNPDSQPGQLLTETAKLNNDEIKKTDSIPTSKVEKEESKITPVKRIGKEKTVKSTVLKNDDYQKVKKALESVALNLNEGLEQLNSVSENLAQTTEIISSNKYK